MNARWLCVFGLLSITASAATRIDLNRDWSFRVESGLDGVNAGWPASRPDGSIAMERSLASN